MSSVIVVRGSALSSSHDSRTGLSTSPDTKRSHVARSVSGIDPACRTGHFSVRYWPGGSRPGSYPASITFFSALLRNTLPTLVRMPGAALRIAQRPRGFVGVRGPDATSFLQKMVSNDVEALLPGDSCEALLLTAKGRVIAPMTVWRRDGEDYLLLTEPDVAGRLRDVLLRSRFAARVDVDEESHVSTLVLGQEAPRGAVENRDYGIAAYELVDEEASDRAQVTEEELERLRIRAGTPRFGREVDDRVLPAEAGLDERAISFTKGCYPGQEPIARQHYRGRVNRSLRVLELEGERAARVRLRARARGKGGRARHERRPRPGARGRRTRLRARRGAGGRGARPRGPHRSAARLAFPAPVAQGIERCPAEAEVACSNHAGRMTEKPRKCGAFVYLPRRTRRDAYSTPNPRGLRSARSRRHTGPAYVTFGARVRRKCSTKPDA